MDYFLFIFIFSVAFTLFVIVPFGFGQMPEVGTKPEKGDYRIWPIKYDGNVIYCSQKFSGFQWRDLSGNIKLTIEAATEEIEFDKASLPPVKYIKRNV